MILKTAKFSLLLILCLLVRLIPVRVPNVEPILASLMPLSRVHGVVAALTFTVLSIISYDVITGTLGVHTLFTLFAYGSVAVASAYYFKKHEANIGSYVRFAILGTLFFDATTGLLPGPLLFDQSFTAAFMGQIPFTALHLLGNIAFALSLSPAIHYLLLHKRKRPEKSYSIIKVFNPKII